MRTAVIDSSAIINLTHLGLVDKLSLYFNVVLVAREVNREVNRKGRFRYRMKRLYANGVFEKCATADQSNIQQLLLSHLDRGEAEALTQAQEKEAEVFIGDERKAREWATRFGKTAVGTARILARLHREGFAGEPKSLVRKLRREIHCRISESIVDEAIRLAGEPI